MSAMTALTVGLTLAMQASRKLTELGAGMYVPDMVSVSMMRELGPLMTSIIIIGRSGSAVTAELGTMRVSEEIEALRVMAIKPVKFLVVPRFIAMMIMGPLLTVFSNYFGLVGGWIVWKLIQGKGTAIYITRSLESATAGDLYSGLFKSAVFAWLVVTISCHVGLNVKGGAEGVGRATTRSVVLALVAVFISNATLTYLFF